MVRSNGPSCKFLKVTLIYIYISPGDQAWGMIC